MRPRRREPAMALSRSSNLTLPRVSDTREDRFILCASASPGLRSSSGAKLTPRTLTLTLALGSAAHGSAVPCTSASSPVPDSFAFSRNGAPQTPVTDPSNCAGTSVDATVRSSPRTASKTRP